ncbi:MAG: T9SS type A sorting domain-containing protein [Bacteroidetes bacterium]|nr:T9SS type A sorting domain-containing protein [Bacteroidota bacterium]
MKKITLSALFILSNIMAFSQWTNLNAPHNIGYSEAYSTIAVSSNGKNIVAFTQKISTTTFTSSYHYTTSHDYGATWQVYSVPDTAGLSPANMALTAPLDIFWDGDTLFVQDANPITKLKKSTNYGASFTVQNSAYNTQSRIIQSPNGKWYHFNNSVLYSSTDKGITWNSLAGAGAYFMEYCVASNGNLVATYYNGVGYSTNGGDSWSAATFSPTGSWNDSKNSISRASDGSLIYLCSTATKIYRSVDNGVTWQQVASTLPVNPIKMLFSGTDIITLSTNGSTHKSTNGGASFTQMTPMTGGILSTGNSMTNSSTDIYISGITGIYKYNSTVGIIENAIDKQVNIFPNPSSNYIKIESNNDLRSVTLYSCLGNIVKIEMLNDNTIDVSKLNKGIYFLRLDFSNGNLMKRIIIEK